MHEIKKCKQLSITTNKGDNKIIQAFDITENKQTRQIRNAKIFYIIKNKSDKL